MHIKWRKISNMPWKIKIIIMPWKICRENIFEFLCKSWFFEVKVWLFRSTVDFCWLFLKMHNVDKRVKMLKIWEWHGAKLEYDKPHTKRCAFING
jgi:hypothetical protein